MKAQKVIVKIEVESLHIDVLRSMLAQVSEQVEYGAESGSLSMDDGDSVKWTTTRTPVEI
jgi:hypothetical protein